MNGVAEQWSSPCASLMTSKYDFVVWKHVGPSRREVECIRQLVRPNLIQVDGNCGALLSSKFRRLLLVQSGSKGSLAWRGDSSELARSRNVVTMVGNVVHVSPASYSLGTVIVEDSSVRNCCSLKIASSFVHLHSLENLDVDDAQAEDFLEKKTPVDVAVSNSSESDRFKSLDTVVAETSVDWNWTEKDYCSLVTAGGEVELHDFLKGSVDENSEKVQSTSENAGSEVSGLMFLNSEAGGLSPRGWSVCSSQNSNAGIVKTLSARSCVMRGKTNLAGWHSARVHSQRWLVAAAAAQSASGIEVEDEEAPTFTSDAIDESNGYLKERRPTFRGISAVDDLQPNGRRPLSDPWFTGPPERRERAKNLKYAILKKSTTHREGNPQLEGTMNFGELGNPNRFYENLGRARRDQVWGRADKALNVPQKQPRKMVAMTVPRPVDTFLQGLDRITSSKAISKLVEDFAGKLTIQDLRQVLIELGTAPERNWAKALQVFDWMRETCGDSVDATVYQSMLLLLGRAKKVDIAESLFEQMEQDGLKPDHYEYTALIAGHVRSGNLYKAIAVLDRMKAENIQPTVGVYNLLIDGCSKVPKGFEIASNLVEQMRKDAVTPDRVTYTSMIIVFSRKGRHREAISIFEEMQQQMCHPDILTFNAVLNAHGKLGDIQGMLQAHRLMVAQQVDPDTVTFNIMLSALGRAGRTKDVCRIYRLMRKKRVTPDVTTCSILVNAYGKVHEWDELDALLAEMEGLGLQPDLAVYNSLISIYGKAGRFEQVELLTKSLRGSNNITFDVITYNTLIDVYGKGGRLSDVIKWFSDMKKHEVKPDVRTFNALVHAYGRASQYDGIKEVLELFRADGSKPDLVFYHTLLFMFGKGSRYTDAWRVIEDMKEEGYTLSLEIYNSLLLVFGRSNAQEAMKVFKDMVSSNVEPNSSTFKVLIEVHARKGLVDECLKIYKMSIEFLGEQLNDSVLSSLFGACCNMRRIEVAEKILSELDGRQSFPCVSCLNWLILGYGRQGQWAKAEQVLERMRSKEVTPNAQSYIFLLEAYSLCSLFDKAKDLLRRMEEDDLITSISANNALIRYYVRSGNPQAALEVLEKFQMTGAKANHSTYTGILAAYGEDEAVNGKILGHIWDIERLQLDPKHGIYTALLGAIPKCRSHKEAYQFVASLQRLDCPKEVCCILTDTMIDNAEEEVLWVKLAGRLRSIDRNGFNLETQRMFQNALIDALWWFGWETRALRVVKISMELGIFPEVYRWNKLEWILDLRGASSGAAQILLLIWITSMRNMLIAGERFPRRVKILLAEEWQLIVGENKSAREAVAAHLKHLEAPISVTEGQTEITATGTAVASWLRQDGFDRKLVFVDSLSTR